MRCLNCRVDYEDNDQYCRQCGAELEDVSRSVVTTQNTLPAVLNSPVPRGVAASVGALALGFGIEIVRRNMLARLRAPRSGKRTVPVLSSVKDLLFPPRDKQVKLPKGYEMQETVVYLRRTIRRTR